jgi:hypothetical protein
MAIGRDGRPERLAHLDFLKFGYWIFVGLPPALGLGLGREIDARLDTIQPEYRNENMHVGGTHTYIGIGSTGHRIHASRTRTMKPERHVKWRDSCITNGV